jgi:ribonucleoside-diphosphate reductase alpha chain
MSAWFTNPFAEEIWRVKYAGEFEDVEEYYRNLASLIATNPEQEEAFFDLMWEKKFSPGGRILAFGGRPTASMSLMNCTTHAIEGDSLEAISNASYTIMKASSRGQGIGIDLSALRPRGAPVNNAARTSSGSVSFMEMLNAIGGTIGQEGRRAALLFSLKVDHPDMWNEEGYDFLNVKKKSGTVENANISVLVTDDYMESVTNGKEWQPVYEGKTGTELFETDTTITAKQLFHKIAESAWESAEPGLLMWDTSKKFSNSDLFDYPIVGVNACTEQILDQEGVCNLGSMNLLAYVEQPFTKRAEFNFEAFNADVKLAIEFLDAVLDVELWTDISISSKQKESVYNLRRVGLGVMGLADAMAALGIKYGWTASSIIFLDDVFMALRDSSYQASIELAKEKGIAPVWQNVEVDKFLNQGFYRTLPTSMHDAIKEAGGTRNITLLSVAPTGSISNLLGVSSGIEPLFAHEYTRRTRINGQDELIQYVHPGVLLSRELGLPDDLWPTAYEIPPLDHVRMQSIAQRLIDQSISKTVNLPADATIEDVKDVYMEAWKQGLKGVTVYRDGSRQEQVLYQDKDVCPICGNGIIYRDGCRECVSCGWGICET